MLPSHPDMEKGIATDFSFQDSNAKEKAPGHYFVLLSPSRTVMHPDFVSEKETGDRHVGSLSSTSGYVTLSELRGLSECPYPHL